MELFAETCATLSIDDLARLKHHVESPERRFSTWLVTVVHHHCVDWLRHREGRRRVRTPEGLSPLQREIFQRVFVERRSHVETYELIHSSSNTALSFPDFLKEIAKTYRIAARSSGQAATYFLAGPPPSPSPEESPETAVISAESNAQLKEALETLSPDERLAIQLFVVDEMPAERVAAVVGWPNAKAVYNRVYRALAGLREELERRGVNRVDG